MSTQEPQEQEQSPSLEEKHTQDTDTEVVQEEEQTTEAVEQKEEEEKENVKTPPKAVTPEKKSPSPKSASNSATKRKFDALHARNAAGEPTLSEHEKNKKARASAMTKTPRSAKKTLTREFSFARPTASSASRTAAAARDHAQAKAKPTPPPTRKVLHPQRTPTKTERAMPTTKPVDRASRPHFNYTPYTGPLPPLTVESSFAPKNSQTLERVTTPAKKSAPRQKAKPTPGKENNGGDDASTNAAASPSKTSRTPGSPVSKALLKTT